jgi:hypothetical protein
MYAVIVSIGTNGLPVRRRLLAGGDRDNHRLADCSRRGKDERRRDAGEGRRHDDFERRLHARRPERVGAFAQTARHRAHRVFR